MSMASAEEKREHGAASSYLYEPQSQTIARDVMASTSLAHEVASFGIRLYSYSDAPHYLQGNPHITAGYRAHLSTEMCVKSSCMWSNETVNIWSHMLGLVYFAVLLLDDLFSFLPENGAELNDYLTFALLDFCFMVCMFCSAGYHVFACQSELSSKRWLSFDLLGVSIGLCGCYFPGAYYAFYCDRVWRLIYSLAMLLMGLASVFAQLHPNFLSNHWYARRLALYSSLVFAGVVPVMHWFVVNSGFSSPIVQLFMPKIALMYVFAVVGGIFYASKFPENMFPGRVNYLGSSHQWWHVMVLLAFCWAHHLASSIFLYWRTHSCAGASPLLGDHMTTHVLSNGVNLSSPQSFL